MKLQRNINLSDLTTICLGGKAEYFVVAQSAAEIKESLQFAQEHDLRVIILGGGSNTVFPDHELKAMVIKMNLRGVEFQESGDEVMATVGAGENWDDFVAAVIERGVVGIEALSGIPGSVGATPVQNVGAYGQEVSETIVSVKAMDRASLEEVEFSNQECGFGYRTSRFKTSDKDKYIITQVQFRLTKNAAPQIKYPELQKILFVETQNFTALQKDTKEALRAVREAVLALRKKKSMVIDKNDPNSKSCGSFFTNPIIARDEFTEIVNKFGEAPNFAAGDKIKIPAAWLIEQAGFSKGYEYKGVGISSNHSLAIINRNHGTAQDVVDLAREIQDKVQKKFGIKLEPEPVIVN